MRPSRRLVFRALGAAGLAGWAGLNPARGAERRQSINPVLDVPGDTSVALRGEIGRRVRKNVEHWLLAAPAAKPAMLQMFRDRDRQPFRDLVPWAGEFAGKYLISGVQALRMTDNARLREHLAGFVRELISTQREDGYLGPFPAGEGMMGKGRWDLW